MHTVHEIAELVGGTVAGDAAIVIEGFAPLETAGKGDVSFATMDYLDAASRSSAGVLVVGTRIEGDPRPQVVVADPNLAFAHIVHHLSRARLLARPGAHPAAVVDERAEVAASAVIHACAVVEAGARIGERSVLFPGVYVGPDAQVGEDCVLYPNVAVMAGVRLGDRVVVHPSSVIGGDGFGYATTAEGVHEKIPQVGTVVVEDDVEIGACTTIDRARFSVTRIGQGTKIDNLVMIAHNVEVGPHCLLVSQSGVAGSTKLGRHVVVGGHTGVTGHVTLGDGAQIAAFSGVSKDLPGGQGYLGVPALPKGQGLRVRAMQRKMPEVYDRLRRLEARVAELDARLEGRAPAGESADRGGDEG